MARTATARAAVDPIFTRAVVTVAGTAAQRDQQSQNQRDQRCHLHPSDSFPERRDASFPLTPGPAASGSRAAVALLPRPDLRAYLFFSSFLGMFSVGSGGSLPYFARCLAAYLSLSEGSQMKHWDLARSCSLHQSPLSLKALATLALHMLHSSSGTPCSSHHQPLWSWAFFPSLPWSWPSSSL